MRRKLCIAGIVVVIAAALVGLQGGPARAATRAFTASGNYTVPAGVTTITLDVYGAEGGPASPNPYVGGPGQGGHTGVTITVTPGDVLQVTVGTAGGTSAGGNYAGAGGQNGCQCPARDGGGGGGISFVFLNATDMIALAGGGGGAAPGGTGGAGGGGNNEGGSGSIPTGATTPGTAAGGGTSTASGTGGQTAFTDTAGSDGEDANGALGGAGGTDYNSAGGGGGGGYFGGGGGGGGYLGGGGGGGSGFVIPSGVDVIAEDGVQTGNGLVLVTTGARPASTTSTTESTTTTSTTTTTTTTTSTSTTSTTLAAPRITLTVPNGGEVWTRGNTQTIAWTWARAAGKTVKIVLLRNGTVVRTLATQRAIGRNGQGSLAWTIPAGLPAASTYRVRVTVNNLSPATTDTSNANFTIN